MPTEDLFATRYRVNVDKVRAVTRSATGKTRCPNCSEVNPANRRMCSACGAKLYHVEEENERMYLLEKLQGKGD